MEGKRMGYKEQYNFWLEDSYFDEAVKKELQEIGGDEKEIEDRFYKDLAFGTGGLRGVIGAGTNRMNIYTVRKATQGLANYIKKQGGEAKGVAIAYDSRMLLGRRCTGDCAQGQRDYYGSQQCNGLSYS